MLLWIVASATYCCVGSIFSSTLSMPSTIASRSASLMLGVRSATTTTSSGFGDSLPQEPLQATDDTEPVSPCLTPMTGAKSNGTTLESAARTVLQVSPCSATQGIAHSLVLQRRPG